MISKSYFKGLENVLLSNAYKPVILDPDLTAEILADYLILIRKVSRAHPQMLAALMTGLRYGSLAGYLTVTVKTHNADGEVSMRGIHACKASDYKPAMSMLVDEYREQLDALPHLLRVSFQLKKQLQELPIGPNSRFVQLDVKGYYMTGDHGEYIRSYESLNDHGCNRKLLESILKINISKSLANRALTVLSRWRKAVVWVSC